MGGAERRGSAVDAGPAGASRGDGDARRAAADASDVPSVVSQRARAGVHGSVRDAHGRRAILLPERRG